MRCMSCQNPYHPATGHAFTATAVICGACAKEWLRWLRVQLHRKSGGIDFYTAAATSIRPLEQMTR